MLCVGSSGRKLYKVCVCKGLFSRSRLPNNAGDVRAAV